MAEHYKGREYPCPIEKQTKDFKVFSAADTGQISVLILNQKNKSGFYKYCLQFGNVRGPDQELIPVQIKNIRGLNKTIIFEDLIEDESTVLLVFNFSGQVLKK